MKFITYNDYPGGIYKSQVIDVCRFLETTFHVPVELIAFVSIRTYLADRKKIKGLYRNSTILPSFPGINNWRKNKQILNLYMLFQKKDTVITRGVFTAILAIDSGKFSKICFDARAAYAAEWKEYLSKESPIIAAGMSELEKQALEQSDFRMAVSEKLVDYWKENYSYNKNSHVVIPCTIDSNLKQKPPKPELRGQMGVGDTDILLVFSGSSAGWQSMNDLYKILKSAFNSNSNLKLLLLSKDAPDNEFLNEFPGRVIHKWVEPEKVQDYLSVADYGLLYRENSVTNKVSSPVKFAEYLAAGLSVIISDNVGDYSSFVKEQKCGMLFDSIDWAQLKKLPVEEKERIRKIAVSRLTKAAYTKEYNQLIKL
ncbi:MAG TPA: hypothetical protein VK809_02585 [Bacteroidia bacterium]|jgi:glycosyltransferase involved in cell wall biosynthesis|nr:hypothetical protein [Bacteroidia bacterium]